MAAAAPVPAGLAREFSHLGRGKSANWGFLPLRSICRPHGCAVIVPAGTLNPEKRSLYGPGPVSFLKLASYLRVSGRNETGVVEIAEISRVAASRPRPICTGENHLARLLHNNCNPHATKLALCMHYYCNLRAVSHGTSWHDYCSSSASIVPAGMAWIVLVVQEVGQIVGEDVACGERRLRGHVRQEPYQFPTMASSPHSLPICHSTCKLGT